MIRITLGELKDMTGGLDEIMAKDLPVKTAYWFGKLARILKKEIVEFEESRKGLIEKHALRDGTGNLLIKDNKYQFADQEPFNADFKELLETEIEIHFNPVSLEQFGEATISPMAMVVLDKFIQEVQEVEDER